MGFWLLGWAFGEITTIITLVIENNKAPGLFLLGWLGAWTVGGGFAIIAWLWNVKGKEVIRIDGFELSHVRDFVLFKRAKEYELAHVKDMRTNPGNTSYFGFNNGMEFLGVTGGTVVFDYGASTHKFGSGLDEAEGKHIIEMLRVRYKNL